MKKLIIFLLLSFAIAVGQAQSPKRPVQNPAKKNVTVKRPQIRKDIGIAQPQNTNTSPGMKLTASIFEDHIGDTRYDLQSNHSTPNRIYTFPDATISAVWTLGFQDPGFADRGSGYNYFDGTSWGNIPAQKLETVRSGWPSIFAFGPNGEGVVSHDISYPGGLLLNTRSQKGSGAWTETVIPGPQGQDGLVWPRAVSNGINNNTIHIIAMTRPTYVPGGTAYLGQDGALLYSRSTDGGITWDIANQVLPGMGSAEYDYVVGDCYAWAEPRGDTLAFVCGYSWYDQYLMKSTDNGVTWTKTIIWQFPIPHFVESHDLITDTLTTPDGFSSVCLDNQGKAHVFFGLLNVMNADTTDSLTTIFTYTDGLAYWNENMPSFSTLNPDSLWNEGKLVGYLQDINGNDTVMEFDSIGEYYCSLSSMPNATIDEQGRIYIIYTSVNEGLENGHQTYRHIWGRMSNNGGESWGLFVDLTRSIIHNFNECIAPSVAARSDEYFLHIVYQYDEEPGMAARGDGDPYGDNIISYMRVSKMEFEPWGTNDIQEDMNFVGQNYPNPFSTYSAIQLKLQKGSDVILKIHDMLGKELCQQSYGYMNQGKHLLDLDASQLSPGIYFYTLEINKMSFTRKMVVE